MPRQALSLILLILLPGIILAATPEEEATDNAAAPASNKTLPTERAIPPSPETYYGQAAQQHYLDDELIELMAGDRTFFSLYLRQRSGNDRGAVILVPAPGQHADWPDLVSPLRHTLPDAGWNTISIEPPALPRKTLPERGDPAGQSNDDQTADNAISPPINSEPSATEEQEQLDAQFLYEQQFSARILAANELLISQGTGQIVVVAFGDSALIVANLLAEQQLVAGALVLINAGNGAANELPEVLQNHPRLTLDISTQARLPQQASERLAASRRAGNRQYYQLQISNPSSAKNNTETQLVKRIRSWLQRRASKG